MFRILCPNCKHRMKYQAMTPTLKNKSKKCVYCGKSFRIKSQILKKV